MRAGLGPLAGAGAAGDTTDGRIDTATAVDRARGGPTGAKPDRTRPAGAPAGADPGRGRRPRARLLLPDAPDQLADRGRLLRLALPRSDEHDHQSRVRRG